MSDTTKKEGRVKWVTSVPIDNRMVGQYGPGPFELVKRDDKKTTFWLGNTKTKITIASFYLEECE